MHLAFKSLVQHVPCLIMDVKKQTLFVFSVGWNDVDYHVWTDTFGIESVSVAFYKYHQIKCQQAYGHLPINPCLFLNLNFCTDWWRNLQPRSSREAFWKNPKVNYKFSTLPLLRISSIINPASHSSEFFGYLSKEGSPLAWRGFKQWGGNKHLIPFCAFVKVSHWSLWWKELE